MSRAAGEMKIKLTVREDEEPELYDNLVRMRPRARAKTAVSLAAMGVRARKSVSLTELTVPVGLVSPAAAAVRAPTQSVEETSPRSMFDAGDDLSSRPPEPINADELGDLVDGLTGGVFG